MMRGHTRARNAKFILAFINASTGDVRLKSKYSYKRAGNAKFILAFINASAGDVRLKSKYTKRREKKKQVNLFFYSQPHLYSRVSANIATLNDRNTFLTYFFIIFKIILEVFGRSL